MSFDRKDIADSLYRARGAGDAALRQALNQKLGDLDLVEEVVARMSARPSGHVLDIGCGNGQFLAALAKRCAPSDLAVGLDYSQAAVSECGRQGFIACLADAVALPFADAAFAAITCNYAAYYFSDLKKSVEEWRRVLSARGIVVASGPASENNAELYAFHREAAGKEPSDADLMATGFIAGPLLERARESGFEVVACETMENRIHFSAAEEFLAYWASTSLFIRTVLSGQESVLADGRRILENAGSRFTITKRVTLLTLRG